MDWGTCLTLTVLVFIYGHPSESCMKERVSFPRKSKPVSLNKLRTTYFGLDPGDELVQTSRFPTAQGFLKRSFIQKYKGVNVYATKITLESLKQGDQYTGWAVGQIVTNIGKDLKGNVKPKMSPAQAIAKCKSSFCEVSPLERGALFPRTELYIEAGNQFGKDAFCRLVYRVTYLYIPKGTQSNCVLDAMHGAVLDKFAILKFPPRPPVGPGPTRPTRPRPPRPGPPGRGPPRL